MSLQRVDYFKDLFQDAAQVSDQPQIIAALVLSDSLNGCRKALLDISCAIEDISPSEFTVRDIHDHLTQLNNSLERLSYIAYKKS